jgi:hypothetical protein
VSETRYPRGFLEETRPCAGCARSYLARSDNTVGDGWRWSCSLSPDAACSFTPRDRPRKPARIIRTRIDDLDRQRQW